MPALDDATGNLVVRLAYDGPPLAGKTETLRSLGRLMDRPVESLDEAYGRTLWFDWMRYDGGLFDGAPIECEVVALPGQTALEERRRVLLAGADTIVFVADCSPPGQDATRAALARYGSWRATRRDPPALVVQANKRDVAGAWGPTQLRTELDLPHDVPVVETIATDARGVRRAFVTAVGRAVQRAHAHRAANGTLPRAEGPRSSAQLRDRMEGRPPPPPVTGHEQPTGRAPTGLRLPAPVVAAPARPDRRTETTW